MADLLEAEKSLDRKIVRVSASGGQGTPPGGHHDRSTEMDVEKITENATEQELAADLVANGQSHLFENWDKPGVHDEAKAAFLQVFARIN